MIPLPELFNYSFVVRGFEAGIIIALLSPLIGIFLVLRRYSLIADTLAHVSLAGIAIGTLFNIPPFIGALVTAVGASIGIERLRLSKKIFGESALALFLSGSLAIATIILSVARAFDARLLNFLFGSMVTISTTDLITISIMAVIVVIMITIFYKELVYISFDEDAARVSGIPTIRINTILIIIAAVTIALSIPIIGVLLTAALIVIPVISALQLQKNFFTTILYAELFSLSAVIAGLLISFYLNLATGGSIVLCLLGIFFTVLIFKQRRHTLR